MVRMLLLCWAFATPAIAAPDRGPDAERGEIGQGLDLLSEGARRLVEGLLDEAEPRMRGLAEALRGLDWPGAYDPPEMLPNGDIIIRRREPHRPVLPQGEIEI